MIPQYIDFEVSFHAKIHPSATGTFDLLSGLVGLRYAKRHVTGNKEAGSMRNDNVAHSSLFADHVDLKENVFMGVGSNDVGC